MGLAGVGMKISPFIKSIWVEKKSTAIKKSTTV